MDMETLSILSFLGFIISVIILIVFFVMSANIGTLTRSVKRIEKLLKK